MTKWDRALTVALLLSAVLSFLVVPAVVGARGVGEFAEVRVGGRAPRLIPLDKKAFVSIKGKGGACRLQVGSGRVRVVDSNCPNHLCMAQGWISTPGRSIICLPHEIIIAVSAGRAQTVDAVVR